MNSERATWYGKMIISSIPAFAIVFTFFLGNGEYEIACGIISTLLYLLVILSIDNTVEITNRSPEERKFLLLYIALTSITFLAWGFFLVFRYIFSEQASITLAIFIIVSSFITSLLAYLIMPDNLRLNTDGGLPQENRKTNKNIRAQVDQEPPKTVEEGGKEIELQ